MSDPLEPLKMNEPNFEMWSRDLCQLLDDIEEALSTGNLPKIRDLLRSRFDIAQMNSIDVEWSKP
jgi:hypothetical protein